MLIEQQIAERQARAESAVVRVLGRPSGGAYGDYQIKSASGRTYRVALRGPGLFENYCSCPDFAVNTLGTCKHIEAMLMRLRQHRRKALETAAYKRTRASISLQYGDTIEVRLHLPASPSPALLSLAAEYFDPVGLLRREHYRQFAQRAGSDPAARTTMRWSIATFWNTSTGKTSWPKAWSWNASYWRQLKRGHDPLAGVLKTKLLPYQTQGALFAACRGRVVLADDMGLGKTVQALAAVELLRRRKGIERVLVIAPASVKYQWKTEIEKFTESPGAGDRRAVAQAAGAVRDRRRSSTSPAMNWSSRTCEYMHELKPDLIILDEAQRIRNWATATARTIKQLKSRYAFVLTGTPLENKLEELFSVVEFVDGRRLGPAFRFLHEHRMEDEKGNLLGYRGLDRIHDQLAPILLRRTRDEVLKELPSGPTRSSACP